MVVPAKAGTQLSMHPVHIVVTLFMGLCGLGAVLGFVRSRAASSSRDFVLPRLVRDCRRHAHRSWLGWRTRGACLERHSPRVSAAFLAWIREWRTRIGELALDDRIRRYTS